MNLHEFTVKLDHVGGGTVFCVILMNGNRDICLFWFRCFNLDGGTLVLHTLSIDLLFHSSTAYCRSYTCPIWVHKTNVNSKNNVLHLKVIPMFTVHQF